MTFEGSGRAKVKEGSVVSCPSKIKVEEVKMVTGTVWFITADKILVLDTQGYIHECAKHEVYPVEEQTNGET